MNKIQICALILCLTPISLFSVVNVLFLAFPTHLFSGEVYVGTRSGFLTWENTLLVWLGVASFTALIVWLLRSKPCISKQPQRGID